jgi:hypothetical protein
VPEVFVPDVPVPVVPEVLVPEDDVPDEPELEVPEVPLPEGIVLEPLPQPCELPVLLPVPVAVAPDVEYPLVLLVEPSFRLVELHAARLSAIRPPMRMP